MTDKDKMREFEAWFEADAMPAESDWFRKDSEGGYAKDFVSHTYYGWQAAKESSRNELEAAKQRIATLEKELADKK